MNRHAKSCSAALLLLGLVGCSTPPSVGADSRTAAPSASVKPTLFPVSTDTPNAQPAARPATSGDTFFTLGGGYNPSGNQVSLERNVLYFQRVLKQLGENQRPNTILFADGNDPTRDLQFIDPQHMPPPVNLLLSRILGGNANGLANSYRNHDIPGVSGPALINTVDQWFNGCAAQLKSSDRVFLYFTGHGGHGDGSNGNTIMHLWAGQNLTVRDFTQRLDKIPGDVPIVMVMVQCYSGGFANTIFEGGDPSKGPTTHPRAGFFATVHDRTAAGCTPDINEANYQEYSSEFFAALCGTDRMGHSVEKPDYNHDGVISFNEAHAYAIIHEITIDIPVKTSDALLRKYSAFTAPSGKTVEGLLTPQAPYTQLLKAAAPCERAILEGISEQLKITGEDRYAAVQKAANEISRQRNEQQATKMKAQKELDTIRPQLSGMLMTRWPELSNPWHPRIPEIEREDTTEILQTLKHHPQFGRFSQLAQDMENAEQKSLELEKSWAKHQRFLRAAENVALQANLPKIATPEIQKRYAELLALEAGTLGKS